MISIDTIKAQYIEPLLAQIQGFEFKIFTDEGKYKRSYRKKNTVTTVVNGLFSLVDSDIQKLGNGLNAVGIVTQLRLLVPIDDEADAQNEYPIFASLREQLSQLFSQNVVMTIKDENDGKTYVGSVIYSLPVAGMREIRPMIGDSIEYTMTVSFGYVENAVNSSDIEIGIDGNLIPFTTLLLSRKTTANADLESDSPDGEANTYGDNSIFSINMEVPVLNSESSQTILSYLLAKTHVNSPVTVTINFKNQSDFTKTQRMIFGECSLSGAGVTNAVYKVSLIPSAKKV